MFIAIQWRNLYLVGLGFRDIHKYSNFSSDWRGKSDARIYVVCSFIRIYIHFVIWQYHIDLTVYFLYPILDILAHNHLGIDALLESEMTKF